MSQSICYYADLVLKKYFFLLPMLKIVVLLDLSNKPQEAVVYSDFKQLRGIVHSQKKKCAKINVSLRVQQLVIGALPLKGQL